MAFEREKENAATAALEFVEEGMTIGLGTGSTAKFFVEHLADEIADGLMVKGVPTSEDTRRLAESLGVPIYLHPNTPSPQMLEPFLSRGLDAAVYGFACETGLHALRLIVSGLFDRFPKLQIVLGHTGEALPFWLYRLDFMHTRLSHSNRYPGVGPLKRKMSEYLRENFYYTSSGVGDPKPVMYVQDVIGADRMMYAMDYPWQYVVEETAFFDAMPVPPETLKAFYEDNARKVFGIS